MDILNTWNGHPVYDWLSDIASPLGPTDKADFRCTVAKYIYTYRAEEDMGVDGDRARGILFERTRLRID